MLTISVTTHNFTIFISMCDECLVVLQLRTQVPEGMCYRVSTNEKARQQAFDVLDHFNVRVTEQDIFSRCPVSNNPKILGHPHIKKKVPVHHPTGPKSDWTFFSFFLTLLTVYSSLSKNEIRKGKKILTDQLAVFLPDRWTENDYSPKGGLIVRFPLGLH